jgi:hypothetical protein
MNTLKFGNGEWYGKKDTILAYNDLNSNYKPLPFNFSRASKATVINKDGLIEEVGSGQPRVDYLNNTKGALKLEPSRTNLVTYSEEFDNSSWNNSSAVTANTKISPNGIQNADTVTSTLYKFISATNGLDYTVSLFVKKELSSQFVLRLDLNTPNACSFNLDTLTADSGGKIEDYGNDWYRCSFTATATVTATGVFYLLVTSPSIYIWGAMVEQGSYATSYIPTSGSAVTRLAETCNQTTPDGVIGQTEGTMFVDCKINAQGTYTGFSLSDGTTNNEVIVRFTTTDRIEYYLRSGGSQPFGGGTTAFDTDSRVKVAIAYKSGDSVFYVNGTEVASSTNTTIPLNLSKVKFSRGNSTADFSGITKNFKVYNTRLSNSELAALTQV